MTDVILIKSKLTDGQKERCINCCKELKRREVEVMETLENEGVISEACFLSSDEQYVYYFIEALDLTEARSFRIDSRSTRERKIELRATL